jgi:hypothetical protein
MVIICITPSGGIPALTSSSGPQSNGSVVCWGVETQSANASRGVTNMGSQTVYNLDQTPVTGSVCATLQVSRSGKYFVTSYPGFTSAITPENAAERPNCLGF